MRQRHRQEYGYSMLMVCLTLALMLSPYTAHATGKIAYKRSSEIESIRTQLSNCWNASLDAQNSHKFIVGLHIRFEQNGTIQSVEISDDMKEYYNTDTDFRALVDAAILTTRQCAPLKGMSPEGYARWRDVVITFDPRIIFKVMQDNIIYFAGKAVPLEEIPASLKDIESKKDTQIVVIEESTGNALTSKVVDKIKAAGFTKVSLLNKNSMEQGQ